MKKAIAALLAMLILATLVPSAIAAQSPQQAADMLNSLGLFEGTDKGYELDRAPTRQEAITMLVRLLGKEEEALSGTWPHPFTDVANWANPYVGYAYVHGYTEGTSPTTFGSGTNVTASQYLTFVLRALGYTSGVDFEWDRAWELSDEIGLTNGEYPSPVVFTRGSVAVVSVSALETAQKGGTTTLLEKLEDEGVVSGEDTEQAFGKQPPKFSEMTVEEIRALLVCEREVGEKLKEQYVPEIPTIEKGIKYGAPFYYYYYTFGIGFFESAFLSEWERLHVDEKNDLMQILIDECADYAPYNSIAIIIEFNHTTISGKVLDRYSVY